MVEILLGTEKNNVFMRLKRSWIARVILLVSCMCAYEMLGMRYHSQSIEDIILMFVLGFVIMNMFYIPLRLLSNNNVQRIVKRSFLLMICFVAGYYLITTKRYSIESIIEKSVWIVVISLAGTVLVTTVYQKLQVHLQDRRLMSQDINSMEGHDFEYYCASVLRKNGFKDVEVTQGSGDFGIDVIAYKNNIKYGIQCKRYEGNVGWHAVEEAKAGAEYWGCQKAVVMTNSQFTKQAIHGAGRIGVELWNCESINR